MKPSDHTEKPEAKRGNASGRGVGRGLADASQEKIVEFPGLGKTLRFVAERSRRSAAHSLRKVFYRPGAVPLAGDHFCHG